MKYVVVILAFVSLLGCSHNRHFGGLTDLPEGKAELFVIRPSHFANMLGSITVQLDGREIDYLKNADYLNTYLPAGEHTASVSAYLGGFTRDKRELEFTVQPNERIYLFAEFGLEGYFGFKEVAEEEALTELREFSGD